MYMKWIVDKKIMVYYNVLAVKIQQVSKRNDNQKNRRL